MLVPMDERPVKPRRIAPVCTSRVSKKTKTGVTKKASFQICPHVLCVDHERYRL